MTQQNSINQYSEYLNVGADAASAGASAPLFVQRNDNANVGITVYNATAGNAADTRISLAANSSTGSLIFADDGHATASWVNRLIITTETSAAGINFHLPTSSQDITMNQGGALECWKMSGTLERTIPTQPCFLAYNSAANDNVTGDGTDFTVEFDTEIFDQNDDYDNSSDTFTAPVGGRYFLQFQVLLEEVGAAHTAIQADFVTSNRTYRPIWTTGTTRDANNFVAIGSSVIVDMDTNDTVTIRLDVNNGAKTVDVYGAATPHTYFSGMLLC